MSSLIGAFKTDIITIIRTDTPSGYDDSTGMATQGTTSITQAQAVIIPATGKDLKNLPEAQRIKEAIKIYTDEALQTADDNTSKNADVITWRGVNYQIQNMEDWTSTDIPHYKSMAVKVENNITDRVVTG
tara:strand:- start:751 stop:1140 length:390 start_codon:yes stop_codon:yes gene_type:complete